MRRLPRRDRRAGLLGRSFRVTSSAASDRGGAARRWIVATIHPSAILRSRDDESRRAEREAFVADQGRGATVVDRRNGAAADNAGFRRAGGCRGEAGTADVDVEGAVKRYGDVVAVAGVDLHVHGGEFFTLLGPSGSGKTTTLRMIAGFERPDAGRDPARRARRDAARRRTSATSTPSSRTTRSSRT